jgi:hypothetical protein
MTQARVPTGDSLNSADMILTTAFHEQFHRFGWNHMCMGCISQKWAIVAKAYNGIPFPFFGTSYWASLLVDQLWKFSLGLWQNRNSVAHGETLEDQAIITMTSLHEKGIKLL